MGTLINDCDQCFLDSITKEVNILAGITAIIFQFQEGSSTRDPYYDESIARTYKNAPDGVECPIIFASPDRSAIAGEEGYRLDKISTVRVARADLDSRGLRRPANGDIWKLWGKHFDVTESSASEGRFSDTGHTFSYEVSVARRTKSLPEALRMDR